MQVTGGAMGPTHLVALYVATAGLQGNALGSDEEEITLLVYVLIDALQNKVSFVVLCMLYIPLYTRIYTAENAGRAPASIYVCIQRKRGDFLFCSIYRAQCHKGSCASVVDIYIVYTQSAGC